MFAMEVPNRGGGWSIIERCFEMPLAEFTQADIAENYALRLAQSKLSRKVDVFDASGGLAATFNNEGDAMSKPSLSWGNAKVRMEAISVFVLQGSRKFADVPAADVLA